MNRKLVKRLDTGKRFVKGGGIIYTMECLNCNNNFDIKNGDYNRGRGYFCNIKCRDNYVVKNNLRKGKKHPMYNKLGKVNPRYGIKHTDETKEKIRQKALGRKISDAIKKTMGRKGKDNKNWKGGQKIAQGRYREKHKNVPKYKIDRAMGASIWEALKNNKAGRKWESLVGYTLQDLMAHLEKQFDEKMKWDNYGNYWWIDHIKPRSLFKYKYPEDKEFKFCWALKNLQPLERMENIKKSNHF